MCDTEHGEDTGFIPHDDPPSERKRNAPAVPRPTRRTFLAGTGAAVGAFAVSSVVELRWGGGVAKAAGYGSWYAIDPHVHCVVSGDAVSDIGVLSQTAAGRGYSKLLLTDHHMASSFAVSGQSAVHGSFTGTLSTSTDSNSSRWKADKCGTLSSYTAALASSPVLTSSHSLHLAASSSSYGEAFAWYKRGPNLRSGRVTITFSVYVKSISAGSSVFISASLGGDNTISNYPAEGYTTTDGVTRPGRNIVLVWYLGSKPTSGGRNTDIRAFSLGTPAPGQWKTYTVDVSAAIAGLSLASSAMPRDYNALQYLKMAVAAQNGSAEAYFDGWLHQAASVPTPTSEFSNRNTVIASYANVLPAIELGIYKHAMRFDFADASTWTNFTNGTDSIANTQSRGYPAQLNHPGLPGGCSVAEAETAPYAFGADVMEAVPRGTNLTMVSIWDYILQHDYPLIGSWSSDAHNVRALGPSTFLQAPGNSFDALMRSFFEGRAYMASSGFAGRLTLTTDPADTDAFPARYPVYVPSGQPSANATVRITAGLASGNQIVWMVNGTAWKTVTAGGSAYTGTQAIPLSGSHTYVRVEVRDSSGKRLAMSEPILFRMVTGMPAGADIRVSGVATSSGRGYTRTSVMGLTSVTFGSQTLSLTLSDPTGSVVSLIGHCASAPTKVAVNGTAIAAGTTTSGNSWSYSGGVLSVQVKHSSATATVAITMGSGSGGGTTVPAQPTQLRADTTASPPKIVLSWAASTGATDYRVSRAIGSGSATLLGTTGGGLSYTDGATTAGTTYTYSVVAVNTAGSSSPATVTATAQAAGSTGSTFQPVADAYVVDGSTTNYGKATQLRVDGSPLVRSLLRFHLSGLSGSVVSATLSIYANSALSAGYDVYTTSNTTWTETGVNGTTSIPLGTKVATSGPVTTGSWNRINIKAAISTLSGDVNLVLVPLSTTAVSLASRESSNPPTLAVMTG